MKKTKTILMLLCATVLISLSVLGTIAYLADQSETVNTFTVGQVKIEVDEAKVNPDGTIVPGADRVKSNNYHLVPGMTYTKDPTMTVKANSEESYVRMLLVIDHAAEFDTIFADNGGANLREIFGGYNAAEWLFEKETRIDNTIVYEFRYKESVKSNNASDKVLPALFTSLKVPGELDGDDMRLISNLKITVTGHAIQRAGFNDANAAWAAFETQINK